MVANARSEADYSVSPKEFSAFLEKVAGIQDAGNPDKLNAMRQMLQNIAMHTMAHQERKRRPFGAEASIITEPTYTRVLTALPEKVLANKEYTDNPDALRRELDNRRHELLNPGENVEILTPHPTSSLDVDDIKRLQAVQNYMEGLSVENFEKLMRKVVETANMPSLEGRKAIVQRGGQQQDDMYEDIRRRIVDFYSSLDIAKKLTPMQETDRAIHFGEQRYHAIGHMLRNIDRALDTMEPTREEEMENKRLATIHKAAASGLLDVDEETGSNLSEKHLRVATENELKADALLANPRTRITSADLKRMGKMAQTFSWQGDQDNKPNMTSAVIEAAIQRNMESARRLYLQSLNDLIESFEQQPLNDGRDMRQAKGHALRNLKDIRDKLENQPENFRAENFIDDLDAIKNRYEQKGGEFPPLLGENGKATRFSLLDTLIIQAYNCGDCLPKVEIRQNANNHRQAFEYIKTIPGVAGASGYDPEQLYKAISPKLETGEITHPEWARAIREHVAEIEPQVLEYYKEVGRLKSDLKNDPKNEQIQQQIATLEAEHAKKATFYETMKTAELTSKYPNAIHTYIIAETGHKAAEEAEHMPNDDEKRRHIAEGAKQDVFSVMFFKRAMTTPDRWKELEENNQLNEIVPLMEERGSIKSAAPLLDKLVTHSYFQKYIEHSSDNEPPQVYDPAIGGSRTMTVAEAKIAMGADPDPEKNKQQPPQFWIDDEDWRKPLKASKTVMFAGSDSMRENGVCIGPLNYYNQQQQALVAINEGYWIDIFNGTGGAVHRSNPAPYISARRTVQGAENHYMTPQTLADTNESFIAYNTLMREGVHIPDRYAHISASYPGHIGNALMMPMETNDIVEKAFKPLEDGCKAHAAMFEDKRYDRFFQKATALTYTKSFNFSARPDARVDREFTTASLRAIGYNLSLFSTGANNTLYKGMSEFLGINEDGSFDLARTLELQQNSSKIQDMMTRATYGLALSDFDNAWKYVEGAERSADGKSITMNGQTLTIEHLAKAFNENKEVEGFSNEALVMAHFEVEQRQTARAIYETYRTLQAGGPDKVTDEIRKEWNPETFRVEQLFDIMPPTIREEVTALKERITEARHKLAEHHDSGLKNYNNHPELEKLYQSYLTITEGLESGSHLSLRNVSRTFTNDFVMKANDNEQKLSNGGQAGDLGDVAKAAEGYRFVLRS